VADRAGSGGPLAAWQGYPCPFSLGCPLCVAWWGCEWPREQLIYLVWWRFGGAFQGAVGPGGEVGQERGEAHHADFLIVRGGPIKINLIR